MKRGTRATTAGVCMWTVRAGERGCTRNDLMNGARDLKNERPVHDVDEFESSAWMRLGLMLLARQYLSRALAHCRRRVARMDESLIARNRVRI